MELRFILFLHTYESIEHTGPPLSLLWHAVTMKQIVFCDGSAWVLASLTSLGCLPSGSPITVFRYTALQSETAQNAIKRECYQVFYWNVGMFTSQVNNSITIHWSVTFVYLWLTATKTAMFRPVLLLTKNKTIKNYIFEIKQKLNNINIKWRTLKCCYALLLLK